EQNRCRWHTRPPLWGRAGVGVVRTGRLSSGLLFSNRAGLARPPLLGPPPQGGGGAELATGGSPGLWCKERRRRVSKDVPERTNGAFWSVLRRARFASGLRHEVDKPASRCPTWRLEAFRRSVHIRPSAVSRGLSS